MLKCFLIITVIHKIIPKNAHTFDSFWKFCANINSPVWFSLLLSSHASPDSINSPIESNFGIGESALEFKREIAA